MRTILAIICLALPTLAHAVITLTTIPGGPVVLGTGTRLTDEATLAGAMAPTGTITFLLSDPSSVLVDTEIVTVSGNGTYTTPTGFLPTLVGTYTWVAAYSGDANNDSKISPQERVQVTPEPSTFALLGIGLAGIGFARRRRVQ